MPSNIEFLSLQGSGIKELPLSVWSNERISEVNSEDCKELEKLPSSTCNLKVSGTFSLDHCLSLGEFSELPKDISVLDLARTSTKLLPISSMAHLFSLTTVKLKDCQKLESLPIGICKLKSLKELDLTGCSRFEYFPVILDPKEHLDFLSLEETAIKELHSTIEFLPVLKTFQLKGCKRLESLPMSICKLKCLEGLDLSGCSRFKYFPEILEPMEHMEFLCFKGTAVKKLPCSIDNLIGLQTFDLHLCGNFEVVPSSIYNLKNLVTLNFYACQKLKELPFGTVSLISSEVLNLGRSGISEIPDSLVCSASLKDVNLSETLIRSIPACIKEAPRLSRLWLTNCKMLQSLPELPVLVYLEAEEHNARSNIMADAQLRILRVARWYDSNLNPHHVFVTNNAFELEEDAKYSTNFYKLVTEASVHFWPMSISGQPTSYLKVEKYGISLLRGVGAAIDDAAEIGVVDIGFADEECRDSDDFGDAGGEDFETHADQEAEF
nr:disease resistance-like protein DSC1 [Malus domestica]